MKLIIAIIHDEDNRKVMDALNENGFIVTKLCSTGGFLKAGNTTLLIGVDEDKVQEVISIIEKKSKMRKQMINSTPYNTAGIPIMIEPIEITVGGATIFVTDVERFEKV